MGECPATWNPGRTMKKRGSGSVARPPVLPDRHLAVPLEIIRKVKKRTALSCGEHGFVK